MAATLEVKPYSYCYKNMDVDCPGALQQSLFNSDKVNQSGLQQRLLQLGPDSRCNARIPGKGSASIKSQEVQFRTIRNLTKLNQNAVWHKLTQDE